MLARTEHPGSTGQTGQDSRTSRGDVPDLGLPRSVTLAFAVAAGIQLVLWWRSWLYFDQALLYRLGIDFATGQGLQPFGKQVTGGGVVPGSLLQLAIGLPMRLWFSVRAPSFLLVLAQLAVLPLLYRSTARLFASRTVGSLTAVLFALSPWRLYHGGFIWEPNYLLVLGPIHFWACVRLHRTEHPRRLWPSLVLGWTLLAAPQFHLSGVILILATTLLLAQKWIRPNWLGLLAGLALGCTTLLGTLRALLTGNYPFPESSEATNLFEILPILKALAYWFRIASSDVGRRLRQAVDSSAAEASLGALAILVAGLVLWAHWNIWRENRSTPSAEADRTSCRYSWSLLIGLLIATAINDLTPQGWYFLVATHGSIILLALWLSRCSGTWRRRLLASIICVDLLVISVVGWGHPMYVRPTDPAELRKVSPDQLQDLEPELAPFGGNWRRRQGG